MDCKWCDLSERERQWLLFEHGGWTIYLADVQDYIGRCIIVLNRHCGCIPDLHLSEWLALKEITAKMERCYKEVLGAELCNWSCLMNSFYKEKEPNPHLHIHIRPRYKRPVEINGNCYVDEEFGHHYALKKGQQLKEEDRIALYNLMKAEVI